MSLIVYLTEKEIYKDNEKLTPLVTEISWTNNLIILSSAKTDEEREFYLFLASQEKYSKRELERQISSGVFERTMLGNEKLSTVVRELRNIKIICSFYDIIHLYITTQRK